MIIVRSIDTVRRLGLSTIAMVVAGAAMTPAQAGPEAWSRSVAHLLIPLRK
jgi:hypothetical protein